jgi:hypothetical protein
LEAELIEQRHAYELAELILRVRIARRSDP